MRFEAAQHMRLGQQMKLAPRMIQSMEILQMPMAELEERIEQELESNATLEVVETEADAAEIRQDQREREREEHQEERPLNLDERSGTSDFERLESYEQTVPEAAANGYGTPDRTPDLEPRRRAASDGERDAKMDAMAAAPARAASLTDQLLEQWGLAEIDAGTRPLGELLISFLDEDGYLRTPLEAIADRAPIGSGSGPGGKPAPADLERALAILQKTLDPPGIGARDVRESLLLQLDASSDGPGSAEDRAIARALIHDHLDDLMHNRIPRIAERAGIDLQSIKRGVEVMRKLSLAPARRLVEEPPTPIIPDAIVEYEEEHDRYYAYLNETRLPNLRVNQQYALMARDKQVPQRDREFIRTNLSNAQWLIDAVNQRRQTLLRVIGVVVEAQREYFDYGPQALKPLPMTQVAEQLGVHVATVSRAVADKYIQTPRGVVPLRRFFTGGLATEGGGEMSYDAVRAALEEVVGAEDKRKPLSDDAIAEELRKRGIEIARRTVAKYRDQLKIPSARLRKTF